MPHCLAQLCRARAIPLAEQLIELGEVGETVLGRDHLNAANRLPRIDQDRVDFLEAILWLCHGREDAASAS
jgi:hypothetical protein